MGQLKTWTSIAIIVIAVLLFGCIVCFAAFRFFSLDAQVNQNTANIQSIVNSLNQHLQASPTSIK
jgi:hypothetical protein